MVPAAHPAADILAAFAGLTIGCPGTGVECAASDIHFCFLSPDEETGGPNEIDAWNRLLGDQLVGIGEVHHAHGELFICASGRCFGRSTVHDAFYFEGQSLVEALGRLLDGKRSRPMLRPDQHSVDLYGITYTADSPEVYKYR